NGITSVTIDFGDGTQTSLNGNTTSVQHSYAAAGTYSVTAVASDSSGATGSGSPVIVGGAAANASFTLTPDTPAVNTAVSFDATASSSSSTVTNYSWNFGD